MGKEFMGMKTILGFGLLSMTAKENLTIGLIYKISIHKRIWQLRYSLQYLLQKLKIIDNNKIPFSSLFPGTQNRWV